MTKLVKVYEVVEHLRPCYSREEFYKYFVTHSPREFSSDAKLDYFVEKKSLPIKYYQWSNGKEIWAVLPEDLCDILGIEMRNQELLEKMKRELYVAKADAEVYKKSYFKEASKVLQFEEAGFLKRLKYLFRRKL